MYVKRKVTEAGGASSLPPADEKFAAKYPATWEFLTLEAHEDGKPRKPSKMSLSVQDGRWCVCFVDDDSKQIAFLSAVSFADLLAAVEKRLASDSMEWRKQRQWGKKSS